jgi:serine carboxypeptidase-like clade II
MRTILLSLLVVLVSLHIFPSTNEANMQTERLQKFLRSSRISNSNFGSLHFSLFDSFSENSASSTVYAEKQAGLMEKDRISSLPGQPNVDFAQYSGYVYLDSKHEEGLFYYLVESPQNSSTNPLLLWLNGGNKSCNFFFVFCVFFLAKYIES